MEEKCQKNDQEHEHDKCQIEIYLTRKVSLLGGGGVCGVKNITKYLQTRNFMLLIRH